MPPSKYVAQYKTIEDLRSYVNELIEAHRDAKTNPIGVLFRVVVPPNDSTSYIEGSQGPYQLVEGVRVCDYNFDKASGLEWVLPDRTMGLSFSKTFSHLKNVRKMLSRHAKGYKNPGPVDVSWWVLGEHNMPSGMEFIQDPDDKNHFFLAVTERMHVRKLVENLQFFAYHMNMIQDETF
ncbi:hypothetical protein [Microbulbifer taiwanensis]|uniref:Uncharacterized protein n=1 Tax=Microbulbifer taiwanensis TaxID=986746 RepID=A0ABW1YPI6_9GAMM|nr:hypothetical protein [Microbulbifer taiwanensis]